MVRQVEMVDSLKSNGTQDKDDKVSGETCCVSISSNQNGTPLANAELVHLESNQKCIEEVQSTPASEALQNCLTLLYKRRQEVVIFPCFLAITIIHWEKYMEKEKENNSKPPPLPLPTKASYPTRLRPLSKPHFGPLSQVGDLLSSCYIWNGLGNQL